MCDVAAYKFEQDLRNNPYPQISHPFNKIKRAGKLLPF
nr:MAG TPA: hypothetical protein [Caudoviricetes sp.]